MSQGARKKKINRGKLNYAIDAGLLITFILSMASGIFLLFLPSGGGFQGGRNIAFQTEILGMGRWFLKDLHTYSSILMGIGVLVHLLLHWNWIVCMTRNIFLPREKKPAQKVCDLV